MVMYVPVEFEFDWTQCFRVRVWKQKCWRTDKWTKNRQTNRQNYTNFERNLAVMVIYLTVKLEFDWTNIFRVRVRKRKFWRTKNGRTNTRNYTNYERDLAVMVIYVPVKFEFDWTKRFWVRVRKQKKLYIILLSKSSICWGWPWCFTQNKHSDECIYLPPYKLDVLKITYLNKVL